MKKYLLGLVLVGFSVNIFALICPTNIQCPDTDVYDCNIGAAWKIMSFPILKRKGTYNFSHATGRVNYAHTCYLYETTVGDSYLVLENVNPYQPDLKAPFPNAWQYWGGNIWECRALDAPIACPLVQPSHTNTNWLIKLKEPQPQKLSRNN